MFVLTHTHIPHHHKTGIYIVNIDCHCPTAHGLLHDLARDSEYVRQGPPGPPGPPGIPGQHQWISSRENVVDVVEYLRCKI